ncbi:MAG: hypothetical protein KKG00_17815 [Bacteroidetes bacterium]|nr:hypothetical protein [Bacteroidota bacterium]
MPKLADYKILREAQFTLSGIGDTETINFQLPPGALLIDTAQRPYITFSESAGGAGPLVLEITLNGTAVNTHTYTIDPQMSTRTVIIDGSTFINGQNALIFTQTAGGGTLTFQNLIAHFQQQA